MKSAIITGATGAIGTALINELINNNVEVLVILRENSLRNERIIEHPLVKKVFCNLEDLSKLENDTGHDYDVFYHFAWEGTTGAARDDAYLQMKNIKYSIDAVGVAKRFGCKRFVGAGSQAEYGRCEGVLTPYTPPFPENGYGMAKLAAGQLTRLLAEKSDVEHIWVRVLSVYGPNDNENSMVQATVNKLRRNIVPEFTKGEQMWDYLHSFDAARAFFLIGEKGVDKKVYVLGGGKAQPLKNYIFAIHEYVNPLCEIKLGAVSYSLGQVMHLEADISELTEDTGFVPMIEFEDGIKML